MEKGQNGVKPFRDHDKYAASSMEAGELAGEEKASLFPYS